MEYVHMGFKKSKLTDVHFIEPDSFELRTDRPCVFLQKICLFILRKLKAYRRGVYTAETFSQMTLHIDTDKFIATLLRTYDEIRAEFDRKPSRLYIGTNEFSRLMNSEEIRTYFMFTAQYRYQERRSGQDQFFRASVHNIEIHVIPWMQGMLLI